MLGVLGLDPLAEPWASRRAAAAGGAPKAVEALVHALLQQRDDARARRDFTAADAIRDDLRAAGVSVEDTPHGPRWTMISDGV
jgi:cysteinyl-tRNA synthetase